MEESYEDYYLKDYNSRGILLKMTCQACPEQYDAYDGTGSRIGYLRLRHGYFRVDCPYSGGETVFSGNPKGDGIFQEDEREEWLEKAITAIKEWKKLNERRSR